MSDPIRDALPAFVLEALGPDATEQELGEVARALAGLSESAPQSPSASARARLFSTVSSGAERYGPFFSKIARTVDLGLERVREIVSEAQDEKTWVPGPLPGVSLFHFSGGPAVAQADTGLIRFPAGMPFPEHKHLGRELTLILEGGYRDSTGRLYLPGDLHEMTQGTTHSYVVLPDRDLVVAVVLEGGIEIGGVKVG